MVPKKAEKARLRPHLPLEKPRRPFCDQKYRRVDGKQETRLFCSRHGAVSPRRLAASTCAHHSTYSTVFLARVSRHVSTRVPHALSRRSLASRPRCWPISAVREARGVRRRFVRKPRAGLLYSETVCCGGCLRKPIGLPRASRLRVPRSRDPRFPPFDALRDARRPCDMRL